MPIESFGCGFGRERRGCRIVGPRRCPASCCCCCCCCVVHGPCANPGASLPSARALQRGDAPRHGVGGGEGDQGEGAREAHRVRPEAPRPRPGRKGGGGGAVGPQDGPPRGDARADGADGAPPGPARAPSLSAAAPEAPRRPSARPSVRIPEAPLPPPPRAGRGGPGRTGPECPYPGREAREGGAGRGVRCAQQGPLATPRSLCAQPPGRPG